MFAVFVVIGGMLTLFGRALFKPTIFIAAILATVFVAMFIFYTTFLKTNTETWVGWAVLGGSVLGGLILGFILAKFVKVGAFVLAAWGGYAVGLLLYNSFLYKMNSDVGMWCVTIGIALLFGVLSVFLYDHILIHSTAILGSFMFVYGIGLVAGNYQNPFTIATLIQNGQLSSIDPIFYAYMAGNLVLYALGCFVQYRHKREHPAYHPEESFGRKRQHRR